MFLLFFLLLLSSSAFAQTTPVLNPNIISKYSAFNTNELKSLNLNLQSNKNKNFTIEHKTLMIGNDLKNAPEFESKINYGVKTFGGGIFSLNAINTRQNWTNENAFLGMNYIFTNKNSSISFSYKNLDNTVIKKSNTEYNLMELEIRAKF